MKASENAHDWHCEDHDTYGWMGEACPMCPKARGETEVIEQLEAELQQARQTAEFWKAEHLSGNQLIDGLKAENRRLLDVVKMAMLVLKHGKGKADSLSIVAVRLCDEVLGK